MVGLILTGLFIIVASAAQETEKCLSLLKPETMILECCHGFELMDPDNDECTKSSETAASSSEDSWNCDFDECIMNKLSLLHANGSFNEVAATALVKKIAEKDPNNKLASERVINKCLSKKFMKYAPRHVCEASKFYICGYLQITLECPKWSDKEECQSIKELTSSCKDFMDNAFDQLSLGDE